MDTTKQKLEKALIAAENMTDAEYLALYEEAKRLSGPSVVISDFMQEREVELHLRISTSNVDIWVESTIAVHIPEKALYEVDSALSLVA